MPFGPRAIAHRDYFARFVPNGAQSADRRRAVSKRTLHALIDKYAGQDAEDLISFLAGVATGKERIKSRAPGENEDGVSYALVPEVPPTFRERITAAQILLAYRHGKPDAESGTAAPGDLTVEGEVNNGPRLDYARLSDAELASLEALHGKAISW